MTDRRRQQLAWLAVVGALWAVFAAIAALSTPLHDDWYQVGWLRRGGGLSLGLLWRELGYNDQHANPRIGDIFLLAVNGSRAVHVIVTPLFELALVWATFVVAYGHRPRATYRDLGRALVLQVVIWLACPVVGQLYFYRPYTTNYLFAFTTTLLWFVPYRLALAERDDHRRWWLIPVLLGVGWLAGMGNEHVGATAIVAGGLATAWAWRRRRLRAWMIAGVIGLGVGYAMLVFAPGQAERYAGRAARFSVLGLVEARGVTGLYDVLTGVLAEVPWAVDLALIAVLAAIADQRRRGLALVGLSRAALFTVAGAIAAAGAIIVTLFASPVAVERLLFAPAVLIAAGLAVIVDHACELPRMRRIIVGVCAALGAYHAARFVHAQVSAHREAVRRLAVLEAGKPGDIVHVPAYVTPHTRWFRGDDFRVAELREYIAHEIYGLGGIELVPAPVWEEPTPVGHFVASRTYDPPLPPALEARVPLPPFAAGIVTEALMLLRLHLHLDGWGEVDGHRLTRYAIDATDTGFVDAKHRPLHLVVWTPAQERFVSSGVPLDEHFEPAIEIWPPSMPAGWTEAYAVGCGQTVAVTPVTDPAPPHDLYVPVPAACHEAVIGVVCDAQECWIATRYSR